MSEEKLICKDCDNEFIIEEGEQKWYEEKKLNLPLRCKDCRQKRKEAKRLEETGGK